MDQLQVRSVQEPNFNKFSDSKTFFLTQTRTQSKNENVAQKTRSKDETSSANAANLTFPLPH